MKKFLLKAIKYIGVIIGIYVSVIFSWMAIIKLSDINPYPKSNKQIFVLGNSHPQFGISDTLNLVNYSMAGETLFYVAIKARKILESNPKATICIDMDPLSIKSAYINLANHRLPASYREYMYFMTLKEHSFLFKYNPLKAARVLFSPNFTAPFHKVGGAFVSTKILDIHNLPKDTDSKFVYKHSWEDEVEMQNFYAIAELIDNYPNNQFIITTLPKSKYWDFGFTEKYKKCLEVLKQKRNVTYFDYSGVVFPDNNYSDLEHLNYIGRVKATKMLVTDLEKKKLIKTLN